MHFPVISAYSTKRKLKDAYARITLNWITTSFFVFSFLHCFAQGIIQSFQFSQDNDYEGLTRGITNAANVSNKAVPYLTGTYGNLELKICTDVPLYFPGKCNTVFKSGQPMNNLPQLIAGTRRIDIDDGVRFQADPTVQDTLDVLDVYVLSGSDQPAILLQPVCSETLVYSRNLFSQAKREDITFVCLQFWLFFISFMAILQDSIPHTLTVLITRVLATSWSAYAIWRTHHRRLIMDELVTAPGTSACSIDLLPAYFDARTKYEIPDLLLNCTALTISVYLSITLLRVYSQQSFKTMGAPKMITRLQKLFNGVLSILQLEVFVCIVAMGLWIDELSNGPIASVSDHSKIYRASVIFTAVLLWPWITLGWYSIRRENAIGIYVFLFFATWLTVGWAVMFYSQVYRWTYFDWPLFGIYATASLLLLVASFISAVVCRLNFGKGLKEYMAAESALSSAGIKPQVFTHDVEKATIVPDDSDPVFLETKKLPPLHRLEIPTPTYYVPELRSADRDCASVHSSDGLLRSGGGGRRLSVFDSPLSNYADHARPASPPLSMSPERSGGGGRRPLVTVTKLSRPAGSGSGFGVGHSMSM